MAHDSISGIPKSRPDRIKRSVMPNGSLPRHVLKNTNELQTSLKVPVSGQPRSVSSGSQASFEDPSRTACKQSMSYHRSEAPHSFPMSVTGTTTRVQTGSLNSPHIPSIFPKSSTTMKSDSSESTRYGNLNSSISSQISESSKTSHVSSTDQSQKSSSSMRSSRNSDKISAQIKHDDNDDDETTRLLAEENTTDESPDETTKLLQEEFDNDKFSLECERQLSNEGERTSSVREPVEHELLDIEDDVNNIRISEGK